jgi:hypothetical protein
MTGVLSCQICGENFKPHNGVDFDMRNPVDVIVRWLWLGADIYNGSLAITLDEVDFYRRCVEKGLRSDFM